ncbi:hypothetical protein [Prosthecobacter algae]|uniref:hypothetical protein n=1 Tax=Prosthecobacter algae TaxID=1144682 RepID=UPI0031E93504
MELFIIIGSIFLSACGIRCGLDFVEYLHYADQTSKVLGGAGGLLIGLLSTMVCEQIIQPDGHSRRRDTVIMTISVLLGMLACAWFGFQRSGVPSAFFYAVAIGPALGGVARWLVTLIVLILCQAIWIGLLILIPYGIYRLIDYLW